MNNRKIVEYDIVGSSSRSELIEKVNSLIKKGYQPIGGLCYCPSKNEGIGAQAMVKYEECEPVPLPFKNSTSNNIHNEFTAGITKSWR